MIFVDFPLRLSSFLILSESENAVTYSEKELAVPSFREKIITSVLVISMRINYEFTF
jgi:hypothetical protein